LINLYQPDSISPWVSGQAFISVSNFFNHITYEKVSIDQINNFISSLSDFN